MLTPSTSVSDLSGIGKKAASKLKRLNIKTVADLLWYLPIRYEDLTEVKKIRDITDEERVTVKGVVTLLQSKRSFRHRMSVTELQLEDDSGSIQAVWFRQPYVAKTLAIGDEIYLSGKAKKHLLGFQLNNPLYEKVKDEVALFQQEMGPFIRKVSRSAQKSENKAYWQALQAEAGEAVFKMKFVRMELRSRLVMLTREQVVEPQSTKGLTSKLPTEAQTFPVGKDLWADEIFMARGEGNPVCAEIHKTKVTR
jgi:RecG-like helicase